MDGLYLYLLDITVPSEFDFGLFACAHQFSHEFETILLVFASARGATHLVHFAGLLAHFLGFGVLEVRFVEILNQHLERVVE
jgi:hypothetical protein